MKKADIEQPIILRDHLAIDRTHLANLRTLLAFIRTGLYFLVTALAIYKFGETQWLMVLASIFTGIGVLLMLIGILTYRKMRRKVGSSYQ